MSLPHEMTVTGPAATPLATEATIGSLLKPASTLAAVTSITNPVAVTNANLDAAISTLLKPADTLAAVTSITNPVNVKQYDEEAGTYRGFNFIAGKPRYSSMPYLFDIAEGNIAGHTIFTKLGYNGDVGLTEEEIWTRSSVYPWIAAAGVALEVVSASASDTLAGTGVQKLRVDYLDTDYSEQMQVLNMNGVTPVALTDTSIRRVNSIRATQVGSGGVAVGLISCRLVGGAATIYQNIAAGYTRDRSLIYTVPLGKSLYLTSLSMSSGAATSGKLVRWTLRAQVDDTNPTVKINFFQPVAEVITQDSSFHIDFDTPIRIPATADLMLSASSDTAGSICTAALRGWLE